MPKSARRTLPMVELLAVTFLANPLMTNGQIDRLPAGGRRLLDNRRVPWDLLRNQEVYPYQEGVA